MLEKEKKKEITPATATAKPADKPKDAPASNRPIPEGAPAKSETMKSFETARTAETKESK
jgi:hypothetical protein